MTDAIALQFAGDIAIARLGGAPGFRESVQLVTKTIVEAREQGVAKLLIDITGLTAFDPPSLSARHSMVRDWAEAAQGRVRGAMVARPEFIDPHKFGVVAARNFGLHADVFETEAEAMEWLRELR